MEPLAIGAHDVRRVGIQPGEHVLVVDAGPIGLGIMELARITGATVMAMGINEARLAFCKEKLAISFEHPRGKYAYWRSGRCKWHIIRNLKAINQT